MILCKHGMLVFRNDGVIEIQATLASTNVTEKSAFWAFKYSPLPYKLRNPGSKCPKHTIMFFSVIMAYLVTL
uniref:Uncharacterized protein n=1 Tax=Anguilla anguilla TaxID=7936 RepID=A0A0E9PM15_ANGAN